MRVRQDEAWIPLKDQRLILGGPVQIVANKKNRTV